MCKYANKNERISNKNMTEILDLPWFRPSGQKLFNWLDTVLFIISLYKAAFFSPLKLVELNVIVLTLSENTHLERILGVHFFYICKDFYFTQAV